MTRDPRFLNRVLDHSSVHHFLADYVGHLRDAVLRIDAAALERACDVIARSAGTGNRVFAIGNGGSAAIADHLCCDLTKGTDSAGHPVIDTTSLVANTALYTALANDCGFEQVFSRQIGYLGRANDVLLAISSSGNSPNILAAVDAAQARGMTVIGLSGFSGGGLREKADISLHVDFDNYGVVEDAHQMIMHVFAQCIAHRRDHGGS